MPDKLFFQRAGERLGLHSPNLQLPLLETRSFFASPENLCGCFHHWAAGRRGGASNFSAASLPGTFVLLYIAQGCSF